MPEFMNYSFLGNTVLGYATCVLVLLAGLFIISLFKRLALKRLNKWAENTATTLDDFIVHLIQSILVPLAYVGAFYLGINTLTLHPVLKKVVNVLSLAILTLFTVRMVIIIITYGFKVYLTKRRQDANLERSLQGILSVFKVIIWGLAIIFFLDNLGFKVSTVIAGLGIGGAAVALASQAILKDLFSYFSIIFDRPFEIGDFLIINDFLGSVEYIGIKTTRIRSLGGEQLIFSNTDLTDSRVRNYKRMERRRVLFRIGVTYQTKLEQLKEIPKIIEKIIKNVKDTVFDRAHFFAYGDFCLTFEIVYYVLGADYNKYMDIQQEINFAIKNEFQKHKIEFAYPTQTLHITKD